MLRKTTAFYRGNTEVSVDFSAERVSSDGAVVLLDKLERKHQVISHISEHIPDRGIRPGWPIRLKNSCVSACLPSCREMKIAMMWST